MGKLTPKQLKFVEEYLANQGHGANAAIKAGYSKKTAYAIASRLLKNVEIKKIIRDRTDKGLAKAQVTVERTLEHQAVIAYSDISDFLDFDEDGRPRLNLLKTPHMTKAIRSFGIHEPERIDEDSSVEPREIRSFTLTLWDKNAANRSLMQHLGMFEPDTEPGSEDADETVTMSDLDVARRIAYLLARGMDAALRDPPRNTPNNQPPAQGGEPVEKSPLPPAGDDGGAEK